MQLKLRGKLMIAFFVLIFLPSSVIGYLSYRQASSALQESIEKQSQETVAAAAGQVESATHTAVKILEIAGEKNEFIEAAANGNAAAEAELKKLQQKNSEIMEDAFIADVTGKIVIMASGPSQAVIKDRDYFGEAMGGKTAISSVVISRVSNKPVIVVARPLIRSGQTVGVLAAIIDFASLTKKVSAIKVGTTGYGYMVDKTGMVVLHPNKDMILKENLLQHKEEQLRAITRKMTEGQSGKAFYTFQGIEKLAAYVPADKFAVAMTVPVEEYMEPARDILRNTLLVVVAALAIAMFLAYLAANSLVRPLQKLCQMMGLAGGGDLTVVSAIESNDEIGELSKSFDAMIGSQNAIVKEVRRSSTQLAAASEEMAAACEEVTSTSEEIASSMQVVAGEAEKGNHATIDASEALLQLSSLIQIAKTKAGSSTENSRSTRNEAEEGRTKVTEAITKIQRIMEHTDQTAKIMAELEGYSKEIGSIVQTITGIASQTNLLALNAAIEAARAGEHGRGFAVVAEEVRKLAEQSNHGAEEISALIHKVTEKTAEAVGAMAAGSAEVDAGVRIVNEAGSALDRILSAVRITVEETEEINKVTAQEVASSDQIVELIDRLATVIESVAAHSQEVAAGAQQQASAMQNVAASAEETSASAISLQHLAERFTV